MTKPLDVGNGVTVASFSPDGCWLSVGRTHPAHGFLELSGLPDFDETWRGDPGAVRRYRAWMTEPRFGFLHLDLPGEMRPATAGFDTTGRLAFDRLGADWSCGTTAWAVAGRPVVVQRHLLRSGAAPVPVRLRLAGRLAPSAFAEITEVNPLPPVAGRTRTQVAGGTVRLTAPALPASALVRAEITPGPPVTWTPEPGGGATLGFEVPGGHHHLELVVTVSLLAADGRHPSPGLAPGPSFGESPRQAPHEDEPERVLDRISWGAARYVLGCTALAVAEDERVVLTDHRLLPLSWTRDAYYQALLLLSLPRRRRAAGVVADHLRWLWGSGRPADGLWQRSHLPDGRVKDPAVQADQQLYPLLELLDYRQARAGWPPPPAGRDWGALVADAWERLPRGGPNGLLVSEETPADDPAELPYALSAQILYWYAAARLTRYGPELGLDPGRFAALADTLPGLVDRCFAADGPDGPQWAYECDDGPGRRLYQDANDLPTAFAPLFGFCGPDHERWLGTMRYAFSRHNPAYVPGPYGGLGSVHTPGTWTLGDAQDLAVARLLRDESRQAAVLARLWRVTGVDGLLPETYHPDTGEWVARHWFAWPASVLGALHLGGFRRADGP